MDDRADLYDVCILGSGLGGTILGAILARHGARVLILDRSAHPRFAIGESTIPSTTGCLKILARRFDVPELDHLSSFAKIQAVAPTCGIKRSFSFFYNRPGEAQDPAEWMEYRTFPPPLGPDIHMYRQDVDAYMAKVAVGYGARLEEEVEVADVEIDDEVRIRLRDGRLHRARFLVDGSGYRSELADRFGLRDETPRMSTRSRVIFTHMKGVAPFDHRGPARPRRGLTRTPFHQSTLHHVFDGGWMWVIPFNNHPGAVNDLTSVGIHLDLEKNPARGLDPEAEFWEIVDRFPAVARHLAGATAARPWVSTGRVQYSSRTAIGDRFLLLPHAAGFVDALFSSGLSISTWGVNAIARDLLDAIATDDFSVARFEPYDAMLRRIVDHYDQLVHGAYVSWRSFELWNAWYRMWTIGAFLQVASELVQLTRVVATGDEAVFDTAPHRGLQAIDYAPFADLFDACYRDIREVEAGRLAPTEAARQIHARVARAELAPRTFTDPASRSPITATVGNIVRLLLWGRYESRGDLRHHFFAENPRLIRLMLGEVVDTAWGSRSRPRDLYRFVRDMVTTRNQEFLAARSLATGS